MSSAAVSAPAPAVSSPKTPKKSKAASKPKKAKAPASHPTFSEMIKKAVTELKDKKGSSRSAILKYIVQNFKVGENVTKVNAHLRHALKKGVESKMLIQTKGTGASGSFRLGEKAKAAPKKAKKPASKKSAVKKSPSKKKVAKKPAAKKAVKSAKVKKSPKKAKKPAAASKPKPKKASPKKPKVASAKKPKVSAKKSTKVAKKAAA